MYHGRIAYLISVGLLVLAACSSEPDTKTACADCAAPDMATEDDAAQDGSRGDDDQGAPASCFDDALNGDESDIDCGGDCAPCDDGAACGGDDDCASGTCEGTCAAASCDDGLRNGNESDVDCGGEVCDRCPDSSLCDNQCDCQSGSCVDGTCRHSLVGSWTGSPIGTTGVRITMDFDVERVNWGQSFNNGQMDCFHNGSGAVSNLSDDSFDMTGYATTSNSCNLGMFSQGDYLVNYQFTNSERSAVEVAPVGNESYRLRRVVDEDIECARPAGPPPIPGAGGFGDLDPYPTYEELFDAFLRDGIDPVAGGFDESVAGEPVIYDCPAGGTVTVAHSVEMPIEDITYDDVSATFDDCGLTITLTAGDQNLVVAGTIAHDIADRGFGAEHSVDGELTSTGDLEFSVACDLARDAGECVFADQIGNTIAGSGGLRSARQVTRFVP